MAVLVIAIASLLLLQATAASAEKHCVEKGAARVVGVPGNHLVGRLEVCVNEEWGTVCNNGFDTNAAIVVCRQLGVEGTHTHV